MVRAALAAAGGKEIESGKFASPESSAALAVNAFGWFLERASDLPILPGLEDCGWPALGVAIERQMRFPWSAGRHPWLDAAVQTQSHLIGIESKRFEPFRSSKAATLSPAYDRDVWGQGMEPFTALRDRLRAEPSLYRHLDAAQLVKHAFGLVTEGRRLGLRPVLFYIFAEPARIAPEAIMLHRGEIEHFAGLVVGATVRFASCSYREWLAHFDGVALDHAQRVLDHFQP